MLPPRQRARRRPPIQNGASREASRVMGHGTPAPRKVVFASPFPVLRCFLEPDSHGHFLINMSIRVEKPAQSVCLAGLGGGTASPQR